MTFRGSAVRREIEDEHEVTFHELVGLDLDAHDFVFYTRTAEERLISQRASLCTASFHIQTFAGPHIRMLESVVVMTAKHVARTSVMTQCTICSCIDPWMVIRRRGLG